MILRLGKISSLFALSLFYLGQSSFLKAQQDLPPEVLAYADKILYNGKVLTADDQFTIGEAVAIRGEKIMAVGQNDRILRMAGPNTEQVDLQGKTVVPGFVEVHTQFLVGGIGGPRVVPWSIYIDFTNFDAALREIREEVSRQGKPGRLMVFTMKSESEKALDRLDKTILDAIAPDVPILVVRSRHGVVNSQALKLLPLALPDPQKDAQGERTGHVYSSSVGYLAHELYPWPDPQEMEELIQQQIETFKGANSLGMTSVGGRAHGLAITILNELYHRGLLTVRTRFSSHIIRMNPFAEGYLKRMGNLSGIGNEWFKLFGADLVNPSVVYPDMYTLKPKLIDKGNFGPFGAISWGQGLGENWREARGSAYQNILMANRYGWPVMDSHVMADAETDLMLEVFERADQDRPITGRRFGMAHGMMRTPEQLEKMGKYGIVQSVGLTYLFYDTKNVTRLREMYGADSLHGWTAIRSMIDAGVKPILETNVPYLDGGELLGIKSSYGEGYTHLWLLEKIITRRQEGTDIVWGADEKASRQEALWMATNWAARFYQDEEIIGTLEPGKFADLLILGGDYMTVPEEQISEIPILQTVVGGKVMWQNPENQDKPLSQ